VFQKPARIHFNRPARERCNAGKCKGLRGIEGTARAIRIKKPQTYPLNRRIVSHQGLGRKGLNNETLMDGNGRKKNQHGIKMSGSE